MSSGTHTYSGNPGASGKDAVRFLIPDTADGAMLLSDEEIEWLLSEESQNKRLAAARALEIIATNEALVQKKLKLLGTLETDGPALMEALLKRATELRKQDDADEPAFDWAEMVVDDFTYRDRIVKEAERRA